MPTTKMEIGKVDIFLVERAGKKVRFVRALEAAGAHPGNG